MENSKISNFLLRWYRTNKRDLPWRNTKDPYKIWLSEVILQQTRVDQGLPYYLKFVKKYPDVSMLAEASEEDVLRNWQGLGYYTRARNLHMCAKKIVEHYGGMFPSTREELVKLPGIGHYTSAAIASLAFGKKEAVVDGNVIRVVTRIFEIGEDISNQKTISQIKSIVDELIPESNPDLFNQAIMEFGATQCTPVNPGCNTCVLRMECAAQSNGSQHSIPFKSQKSEKRTRFFNYLIIEIGEKYLLRKRNENDIWKGLFEFFLIETRGDSQFDQLQIPPALSKKNTEWKIMNESKVFKHLLSHQIIMCRFYKLATTKNFKYNPMEWSDYKLYSKKEIWDLPKSILIDRYLEEELFD